MSATNSQPAQEKIKRGEKNSNKANVENVNNW